MKYYKDINNIVNDMLTIGKEKKKRKEELKDWGDLFYLLQCLNPESDKPSPHCLDEPEDTARWEDICYLMDRLKPKEEE